MPRRRPSYGSQGVVENSHSSKRVGPPQSSNTAVSNSTTTTRGNKTHTISSNPSNVEQWLTSPTIPKSTDVPKKKSIATFSSSDAPQSIMSKGQLLLRNRLRAPAAPSSTNKTRTLSTLPPRRPQEEQQPPQSEIIQQRNGKRFTFDSVTLKEEDPTAPHHPHRGARNRPGMPSPNSPPPPPPPPGNPPKSPNAKRPTHATPASTAATSKQQMQQPPPQQAQHRKKPIKPEITPKPKSTKKIPFLKRHHAAKDPTDEEEISNDQRRPPKPEMAQARQTRKEWKQHELLHRLAGSEREQQQQQQNQMVEQQPSSDIVSVSSSITEHRFQDHGFLQEKRHSTHSRGNSSSSSVRSTRSKNVSAIPENAPASTSGTSIAAQAFFWSSDPSIGKAKIKSAKSSSPNSCSITAATSGSRSDDDISQLTDPVATPHSGQGVSSRAETEPIKNLSNHSTRRRGSDRRPIPPGAPRSMSLASHVPPTPLHHDDNDDRERYEIASRNNNGTEEPSKPTNPFADDSSANRSFTARIHPKQLRKTNRIKLHVYDLVENDTQLDLFGCYFPLGQCFNGLNSTLHSMGTGAYHVGIEINGIEYAYGANSTNGLTGVFTCMPKNSPGYQYRQSIDFGNRLITRNDTMKQAYGGHRGKAGGGSKQDNSVSVPIDGRDIVRSMAYEYMGTEYDLLRKNCCTFAYDACLRLGVRENEIPSWFHNLAAVGAVTQDAAHSTLGPITQAFKEYVQENGGLEEHGYHPSAVTAMKGTKKVKD